MCERNADEDKQKHSFFVSQFDFLTNQKDLDIDFESLKYYNQKSVAIMKFSTSALLAVVLASNALAPKSLVSAESVLSEVERNVDSNIDSDMVPFDSDMNRLTLLGLDPSIPLTSEEAAFLEKTIQEVFNEIHQDMEIDLYAESVSVGTHALSYNETLANATAATSLRGGGRNLERGFGGTPQPDRQCIYISGPKQGERIPGCEYNVELYICISCWMCIDDDMTWGWEWRPTAEPVSGPTTRKPTPVPTLSFRDNVKFYADDDFFDRPLTKKPTAMPTVAPSKKPTTVPTVAPTNKELEKEFLRPLTSKPTVAPTKKRNNNRRKRRNFNNQVLNKIQRGPHKRFRDVKKVRFGRGN